MIFLNSFNKTLNMKLLLNSDDKFNYWIEDITEEELALFAAKYKLLQEGQHIQFRLRPIYHGNAKAAGLTAKLTIENLKGFAREHKVTKKGIMRYSYMHHRYPDMVGAFPDSDKSFVRSIVNAIRSPKKAILYKVPKNWKNPDYATFIER